MAKTTLENDAAMAPLAARLRAANAAIAGRYPGDSGGRRPVHTVYGGAQHFQHDSAAEHGSQALRALAEHAPDPTTFARALDLAGDAGLHRALYERVVEKLRREPVEDFRIDFEDGYGNRSDAEEDGHAEAVAHALAVGMARGTLPPFVGIRIKTFADERLGRRALRTADIVLSTLAGETRGRLPANFVICLPKIKHPEHVGVLAEILGLFEQRLGLASGALKLEIMIETTLSIFDEHGSAQIPRLLEAARGRCVAAHFGTYDYTAGCGITAAEQRMSHPACDFVRQMMQVACAGTGVFLSDGSTNVLPIGPHAQRAGGPPLSAEEIEANHAWVHRAWKLHFDDVQSSLRLGFYQGWDLHPAQLPTRYAAVYDFYLRGVGAATERLRSFLARAGESTLAGEVLEDAATGQALLSFFLGAQASGALTEDEVLARTGLTRAELASRSFVKILEGRRGR